MYINYLTKTRITDKYKKLFMKLMLFINMSLIKQYISMRY